MLSARKEKNMVMGQIITQGWTQSGGLRGFSKEKSSKFLILKNEQSELVLGFQAESIKCKSHLESSLQVLFSGSVLGPWAQEEGLYLSQTLLSSVFQSAPLYNLLPCKATQTNGPQSSCKPGNAQVPDVNRPFAQVQISHHYKAYRRR